MDEDNIFTTGEIAYFNEKTTFFAGIQADLTGNVIGDLQGNIFAPDICIFENGPIIIGGLDPTDTPNQLLQVFGGGYFQEDVGIGTTNAKSKLQVLGDIGIGTVIKIVPYDDLNNGTLIFESHIGRELLSVTNNQISGSLFSINDYYGVPILDVNADKTIELGPYGGNIGVGTTNPTVKLEVVGNTSISGVTTITGQTTINGGFSIFGNLGIGTTNPITNLDVIGNSYISGRLGIGTTNPTLPNNFYTEDPNAKLGILDGNIILKSTGNQGGTYTVGPYVNITGIGYDPTNPTLPIDTYPNFNATCFSNIDYSAGELGFLKGGVTSTGIGTTVSNTSGDVIGYIHARTWSGIQWENAAQIYFEVNNRDITGSGNHPSADIVFTGRSPSQTNQYAGTVLARFEGDNGNFQFNSGYGSAAIAYGCRAWVNTGDGSTINGSGNITSVSEPITTTKRIDFTTAMPDANYSVIVCGGPGPSGGPRYGTIRVVNTTYAQATFSDDDSDNDVGITYWAVFR